MTEMGHSDGALLLDAALENIPYGFCVWSSEFRLVMWNRHYLEIYGFDPQRIYKGMTLEEVVKISAELGNHPDQTPAEFLNAYKKELRDNRGGMRAKSRELLSAGRTIETAHVYSPGLGWVVTHEDVTEEIASSEIIQRRKLELERQNIRLDAAVNNISQGLCMFDAKGRLVICNAPYQRIYRLPDELLRPGTPARRYSRPAVRQRHASSGSREDYIAWRRGVIAKRQYEKNVHRFRGRTIMMQHHPMKDGGWVSTHEDITEQRQQEARIEHLARHDALTELPNRAQFLEEMAASEAGYPARRKARGAVHRSRSFQGGQRHAGSRGRRQAAQAGLGAALGHDARDRYPGAAGRRRILAAARPDRAASRCSGDRRTHRQDHVGAIHYRRPSDRHRRQRGHCHCAAGRRRRPTC